MSSTNRNHIFISYSHKDKEWVEKLRTYLKPLIPNGNISIWDDTRITPGAKWREEIERAIYESKVAVLLVSPDYLASDFLHNHELPALLEAAHREGLIVLWIAIRHSSYANTPLAQFQAVNDPSKPLASLSGTRRDKVLTQICEQIASALNSREIDYTPSRQDTSQTDVKEPKVFATDDSLKVTHTEQTSTSGTPSQQSESATTKQTFKSGLDEGARESNAINDKPQDDVNKDSLGFSVYVRALWNFITSQDTTTPLTISVNGPWGSGKSSLMLMLKHELEHQPPDRLWLKKIEWINGWIEGTFFWLIGSLIMRSNYYVQLGLAFDPELDVTDDNFDGLFEQFVSASIKADEKKLPPNSIDEERASRLKKARFWARQAAKRRKLTPVEHPTVWFNAWKFSQQEQLWAALALAVLEQLSTKYNFLSKFILWAQLTYKRTDKLNTLKYLLQKFIVPLILAATIALYELNKAKLQDVLPDTFRRYDYLIWLAPVASAMWQVLKEIKNPFHLPLDELIDKPNYKEKVGFIGTFEEDFGRIVEVAIRRSIFWKPRKLVIFIDDLDRCSPLQAAGIIEAINLFLDSVGCVFILGMDVSAVATSIEVKYKDLTEKMRKDSPDILSPGSLFLDKIVQVPFNVPRPKYSDGNRLNYDPRWAKSKRSNSASRSAPHLKKATARVQVTLFAYAAR